MTSLKSLHNTLVNLVEYLQIPFLVAARFYIAWVFFRSGLTKLNDWESTLLLFEYEYEVPILSPNIAAYLATGAELALPVLLVIGLLTRFSALGIFILNWVAVISLTDMPQAALNLHYIWGGLCAALVLWGASLLSADRFFDIK